MAEFKSRFEEELDKLRTLRDELRVQLDLGKKDLEDAWGEVDERWGKLESYFGRLKRESGDALEDIEEAGELLLDEVKEGFKRLRELI